MGERVRTAFESLQARLHALRRDTSGQVLMVFALASVVIFAGLGAGIDLATAYAARQRLSEVATLACQYSTRPSVMRSASSTYSGTNGFLTYVSAVNAYAASSLTTQHWSNTTPTGPTGRAGAYFTATPAAGGTTAAGAVPTDPTVEMSAPVPTAFSRILNINSITVHARIACQTVANAPQIVNPPVLLKEGFETPCATFCFQNASGVHTYSTTATDTFPTGAGYVGIGGAEWYIMGYCVETDTVGIISPTVPEGTHTAELDCDNGSGNKGNSSISTKMGLEAGQYELRYRYRARVGYPDYDPTYVCGSTASDLSWANANAFSPGAGGFVQRTNQVNVYLDANVVGPSGTSGSAPLHLTIDGMQHLAGSNLIDECVYAPSWIERSVRIHVKNPGDYWLTFAADGTSDSYGGQLDDIRLCQELCPGPLQDNFPTGWTAAGNGGVNKLLFEDTFDNPTYSQDYPYHYIAKTGNPNQSVGTSGTPNSGWPNLGASGWATAPFNQLTYALNGAYQGSQYIALDGYNGNGDTRRNRLISRPFLLDPGYYQVSYGYISMVNFNNPGLVAQPCRAAPASGLLLNTLPTATGTIRYYNPKIANQDTNVVAAFMASGQLVSTPIGGGAQGSATSYTNPDTTVSTTPTIPPDGLSLTGYDATQVNPLLDFCTYADGFAWVPRKIGVKISKPGMYWLSFSAQAGTADGDGGAIDDVTLTALGSPYLSNPPTSPLVAIPTPAPQHDTSTMPGPYAGFTIVADPFTPPGADQ